MEWFPVATTKKYDAHHSYAIGLALGVGSSGLNHPRHIAPAFRASADQQQHTSTHYTSEVANGDFMPASTAPDISQQTFANICTNGIPTLGCGRREAGGRFKSHWQNFIAIFVWESIVKW